MGRETAYLSLGSNLGDRSAHIRKALESLRSNPSINFRGVSSLYETDPQDVVDQPLFLNMAAAIETDLTPHELLDVLQNIEREAGRVRTDELRRGPRSIDLDILLFGTTVLDMPNLTVPHARLTKRRFVLQPLLELNPDLVHPVTGKPLAECLSRVEDQAVLRFAVPMYICRDMFQEELTDNGSPGPSCNADSSVGKD